jgi:hypothetical protein
VNLTNVSARAFIWDSTWKYTKKKSHVKPRAKTHLLYPLGKLVLERSQWLVFPSERHWFCPL